ncbi:RluA family pseudouridine synthase [Azospirillum brasilense]|uniref:RluA family pseudouridine synthase n=1 Tax=Azospirillum brasilense TaxID=192 RepID=UPI001FEB725F|nr:RluA family pseudouridine synthase [Azospirillum brasilense]
MHRLDKDTSGVLLLARNTFAASKLTEQFRGRDVRKIYWAATVGVPKPYQGKIDLALAKEAAAGRAGGRRRGRRQACRHLLLGSGKPGQAGGLRRHWPRTGRTHQLRVHMNAIGTPILGDGKYAGQGAYLPGAEVQKKLHLHARRLILPHPRGGNRMIDVTAPLPDHMLTTWKYLGFSASLKGDPFEGSNKAGAHPASRPSRNAVSCSAACPTWSVTSRHPSSASPAAGRQQRAVLVLRPR